MKSNNQSRRRGAASVGLSLMLLLVVTATALTTMRGQWARRKAAEASESRDVLVAAIDAAQSLPEEILASSIRLTIDQDQNHWITISVVGTEASAPMLQATEQRGEKAVLSIKRPLKKETK